MTKRSSRLLAGIALGGLALGAASASASEEYNDQFNYGQANGKGQDWVQSIRVASPAYRSTVTGTVNIVFSAPAWTRPRRAAGTSPMPRIPAPGATTRWS